MCIFCTFVSFTKSSDPNHTTMNSSRFLYFNRFYFFWAIALFLIEVFIGMYVHDRFIRPYVGDFLVVILLYCLVRSFWNKPAQLVGLAVLAFSFVLEFLQYYNLVNLLGLQDYKLARIVIGTSFAWEDLIAYALGIGFVLAIEGKSPKPHRLG